MLPPSHSHDGVRASYDAVATSYADLFLDELERKPLDRALLAAFVEMAGPGARVADLGCGPGHVAGWLASHGVQAVGIDLSPAMVALAATHHPRASFRQGDFLDLPASDGEFAAAVAFYSLIHLDVDELVPALREIRRILRPAAPLLISFHVGSEVIHRDEWLERTVDLDFRMYEVASMREALAEGGFTPFAELTRSHYDKEAETIRGYVLARRP